MLQPLLLPSATRKVLTGQLESLYTFHGLCKGQPSDLPSTHLAWKLNDPTGEPGLIWISPVIDADSTSAKNLLEILRVIFYKFGFEFPLTFTFIDHCHLVCVASLHFDKSSVDTRQRAVRALREIEKVLELENIRFYRKGILFQQFGIPSDRLESIREIKSVWDPNGIIAPGRYGLWNP